MVRSHVKFGGDDSDDDYQELPTAADDDADAGQGSDFNDGVDDAERPPDIAVDDSVSDMEYLRAKMRGGTDATAATAADDDAASSDSGDSDDSSSPAAKPVKTVERKKSSKKGKSASTTVSKGAIDPNQKPTVRLRGLPFKATEDDVIEFFHPLEPLMVRLTKDRMDRPSGRAFVDFAPEDVPKALQLSGAQMGDRYIEVSLDVVDPNAADAKPAKNKPTAVKPPHKFAGVQVDASILGDTGRLFVRNLAFSCREEELEALMTKFGPVSEVLIPIDRETKKSKAIGFVTFLMPEHAIAAYQALDGQPFQGRLLHLIPAEEKRDHSGVVAEDGGATTSDKDGYKKQAARKRKAASGSAFNWNSLFMRTDTVAGAMAAEYGVDKADILDPEAEGSMAVRMALGETHVVAENKRFLKEQGVVLDAFDTRVDKRSNTTILVKNTPHETTEEEIRAMFAKHGTVSRVVFPPSHTMALVDMPLPQEARAAFRALAYRKFKHVPLYLEWAPDGCLTAAPASASEDKSNKEDADVGEEGVEREDAGDTESSGAVGSTLFVKNLSFATTEDEVRAHFERVVAIRSVRIATKKNTKDPRGAPLSMGFGFVEFASKEDAMTALKRLQGSDLSGHKLELKLSTKKDDGAAAASSRGAVVKVGGTKLLIRNLPFEANKKELRELCQPFGQIKSVRIPKKYDGEHRGFAFVDFLTKKEAKSAFEALSLSTHLYGRRLVIEWAQDDTSLESLQDKTRASFKSGESRYNKKAKIEDERL